MLYYLFNNQYTTAEFFAVILAFCLAIAIAMSFHEWAHARTAYACGDDTAKLCGRMTLNPIKHISGFGLLSFFILGFGWAKPVPVNPLKFRSYKKNATWVYSSGVLTNFVLAFLFTGILFFVQGALVDNMFSFFIGNFIYFCVTINLSLCFFNLLPIPPLDGSNILAVWTKYGNKFVQFMNKYGFFVLIFLIIPFFGGRSILDLFFSDFIGIMIRFFGMFWGLFV